MYTLHCLESVYSKKKYFNLDKIFVLGTIQNNSKQNWVMQAWTEVSHQRFGDSEVQTMWNLQVNVQCVQRGTFSKTLFTHEQFIELAVQVWVKNTITGL